MAWEVATHEDKGPKVAIWGPSGCLKTRAILAACHVAEGPPRVLVFDYEAGTEQYEKEFRFSRRSIEQVMRLNDPVLKITKQEVKDLLADPYVFDSSINKGIVLGVDFARVTLINRIAKNPIDHVSVDSLSIHTEWEFAKWIDMYMMRETTSKGHKRDYYKLQPNDYAAPNRVLFNFMNRLKALNVGVFCTSHDKPKYDNMPEDGKMMKRVGDKPDAYKKLEFMMDTVIGLVAEEEGKAKAAVKQYTTYTAVVQKDRTNLLDNRFVWRGKDEGVPKTFLTQMAPALAWKGKVTDDLGNVEAEPIDGVKTETTSPGSSPKTERPKEEKKESSPTIPDGVRVTKLQLKQIKWLHDELKFDTDAWKKAMAKRKVTTARDLTALQADELIAKMYEKVPEEGILEYRILFEGEKKEQGEEGASKDKPRDNFSDLD